MFPPWAHQAGAFATLAAMTARWRPNPGVQQRFLACGAFEAFYGGAAGGGKSESLIVAPTRYVAHPKFRAVIFRRTIPELKRYLVERTPAFYRPMGAVYNQSDKVWRFPSGAIIELGSMEHIKDRHNYDSVEYQWCAARGTPVLMADGVWKAIERVRPDDMVATMCGARRVSKAHALGPKQTVMVTNSYGQTVQVSETHPLLTAHGWASPLEVRPSQACGRGDMPEGSPAPSRDGGTPQPSPQLGRLPAPAPSARPHTGTHHQENGAWSAGGRTDCAASDDERQDAQRPRRWSFRAVLLSRAARQGQQSTTPECHHHARDHAGSATAPIGCASGYRGECRCGDGSPHSLPTADPESTQQPSGVDAHSRCNSRVGDRVSTRLRSRQDRIAALHPYTREPLALREDVHLDQASIRPAGEADVFDLTVEGASHYVTWGGFIARNCGFDELTTFEEVQYTYLMTRMRSTDPALPIRLRSASNPGGPGHEWVLKRFAPWLYQPGTFTDEYDGPYASPEERLAFLRGDKDTEERIVPIGTPESLTRAFFPAGIDDNPYIDEHYKAVLRATDALTYAQKRHGDWMARPAPGLFFRRDMFAGKYLDACPADVIFRCRHWDLAATEDSSNPDEVRDRGPDFTAGVRVAVRRDFSFVVEDVARARLGPDAVEAFIVETAEADAQQIGTGKACLHSVEREPGASGKIAGQALMKALRGHDCILTHPTGKKIERARPAAAQARAGNVFLVRAPWNRVFLAEAEMFPMGKKDQIDGLSGALGHCMKVGRGRAAAGGRRAMPGRTGGY